MSKPIAAKPTDYRGQQFRSRLEARWAVFLDYHFAVDSWVYEPRKFHLAAKGWDYTPDFAIKVGPFTAFLEVKPKAPTSSYLGFLNRFLPVLHDDLLLAYGSFYEDFPSIHNLTKDGTDLRHVTDKAVPLDRHALFPATKAIANIARTFRFDLPHDSPPFRSENPGELKDHIAQWQIRQRKGAKRPKRKPRKPGREAI